MPRAELPMGSIHYEEAGPADGRPLVFVHGVFAAGSLWQPIVPALAGKGLRCIVPTWPMGAHQTAMKPGTDLSPGGMANIVAAFVEALDLRDVVLVGNDSGGAISQVVAAEHPERLGALVLTNCDTLEHFPPRMFAFLPRLARIPGALRMGVTPTRLGLVRRSPLGFGLLAHADFDHDASEWVARLFADRGVFEDCRKFVVGLHRSATLAAAEKLRSFGKPIVLVWGEDDVLFPPAHARRFA
nr:alpha/beta hydrolase [Actinomycetota bacterium]